MFLIINVNVNKKIDIKNFFTIIFIYVYCNIANLSI